MTSHRGLPDSLPPLPKSPSGRTPQWVIDEALERQGFSAPSGQNQRHRRPDRGVDRGATVSDWRRGEPPASARRRGPWANVFLVVALIVGLPAAGGYVVLPYLEERRISASSSALPSPPGETGPVSGTTGTSAPDSSIGISPAAPAPEEDVIAAPSDIGVPAPSEDVNARVPTDAHDSYGPPAGVGSAARPIGTPPLVPDTGGYSFLATQTPGDQVVAYDPCRPIHYVVRPDGAPPGGQQLLEQAVAEIVAATGLRFVYGGTTTEAPRQDRQPYQPDRYGDRWAPVLITWSNPTEYPELAGDVAGLGGSTSLQVGNSPFAYVTGLMALDAPTCKRHFNTPQEPTSPGPF